LPAFLSDLAPTFDRNFVDKSAKSEVQGAHALFELWRACNMKTPRHSERDGRTFLLHFPVRQMPISINFRLWSGFSTPEGQEDSARGFNLVLTPGKVSPGDRPERARAQLDQSHANRSLKGI
jgi:hypothetical protein